MSASTIHRRLSLLAGSSLAAVAITLSAGMLAPTTAMAANECAPIGTDPSANGATADTFTCAGSYSGTGITYASAGSLTVNSTGAMDVGTVGINLTGNGADAVAFTSTGIVTGTSGPVVDVTSVSGPISLATAGVTGTGLAVTYGIQAVSTGGGAITISNPTGAINVNSAGAQLSAIRAVSTGGNGAVSVTTGAAVTGRSRGIEAQASGTGALTVTATNAISLNTTAGVAVAAIDARTGTGLLTVDVATGSTTTVSGLAGAAILTHAGGDEVINIGVNRTVSATGASAGALNLTAVGATTVNNTGTLDAAGGVTVLASGGTFTLNNNETPAGGLGGTITGRLDLTGVTGAATVNNNAYATWFTAGASNFGPGASDLNSIGTLTLTASATFTGLETFDNSGLISFRRFTNGSTESLSAPGAAFTGSGDSRLLMDVALGTAGQASCSPTPLIADCLNLAGGSTSGVTAILVVAKGAVTTDPNTAGITLVDVAGGQSHAGDFVLHFSSTNYEEDPKYGAVLTTDGWLGFALLYDDTAHRHYLASVAPSQKLEHVATSQEVISIWTSTSDTIAARQADLRDRGERGAWLRVTGGKTTRDVALAYTAGANSYTYADQYESQTTTAIGGLDMVAGDDFVFGLHGGAVKSTLERTFSPTRDRIDGVTAGLYGSWWNEAGLSLDGTINANFLRLVNDRPSEEISDTSLISAGVRGEAGWRMALGPAFYVQPLASASYVRARIEDIIQGSYKVSWEELQSLRGAVGLRAGGELPVGGAALGYWITGRAWKEFAGDGDFTLTTTNSIGAVAFADELAGEFQELGAGLSLSNASDTVEGYLSGGAKYGDDNGDDYSASFGLRLRW